MAIIFGMHLLLVTGFKVYFFHHEEGKKVEAHHEAIVAVTKAAVEMTTAKH